MNQPFNYTLSVPNPAEAVTAGLQQGVQLAGMMERTDAMAAQRQQTLIENQALQAKAKLQADQRAALDAFYAKPSAERTAADYEAISATLPKEMAENVRASFDAKTKEEQRQDLLFGSQVLSALRLKDTGTASQMLQERAKAYESSGMKAQAQAMQNLADMTLINPEHAELALGPTIAVLPGGKEFIQNVAAQSEMRTKEGMAPGQIAKAIAEGKTAEIVAATEQQMRDAEILLKAAQGTAAKASAGASYASAKKTLREIKHIDAMEPGQVALLAAQGEATRAEAAKKRGEAGGGQAVIDAGQNILNTVTQIKQLGTKPAFGGGVLGAVAGKTGYAKNVFEQVAGPLAGRTLEARPEASDLANMIETLKAQEFMSQIKQMAGMGALSNEEGKKLSASVANLSLTQSAGQLQKNIDYIEETTRKGMEKAQRMMGGGGAAAAPAANVFDAADAILRGGK